MRISTIPAPEQELEQAVRTLAGQCAATTTRVAVAESCTGGWIAKCCTDLPGSSDWFERGLVVYSNEAKTDCLGVPADLVAREGAVSEAVVRAMVRALRTRTGCERLCAVSGVAGPGASQRVAAGVVWFCFGGPAGEICERLQFEGERRAVRAAAVLHALRGLAERCPGLEPRTL